MSQPARWVIRIGMHEALATAGLRLRAAVEACPDDARHTIWLRGGELTAELELDLRKLALDGIFEVAQGGALRRAGSLLSVGQLPEIGWQPLDRYLTPKPQPTAPAAALPQRAALQLERCANERPANVLQTDVQSWANFAQAAPAVRLSVLTMAACQDGRCIIRGTPLPSMRGARYVESEGIAVPCGWAIHPRVDAWALRNLLKLQEGDVALFSVDGTWELIAGGFFARCTRAVSRQTLAERSA